MGREAWEGAVRGRERRRMKGRREGRAEEGGVEGATERWSGGVMARCRCASRRLRRRAHRRLIRRRGEARLVCLPLAPPPPPARSGNPKKICLRRLPRHGRAGVQEGSCRFNEVTGLRCHGTRRLTGRNRLRCPDQSQAIAYGDPPPPSDAPGHRHGQQPVSGTPESSNRTSHPGAPLTQPKHVRTHGGSECAGARGQ